MKEQTAQRARCNVMIRNNSPLPRALRSHCRARRVVCRSLPSSQRSTTINQRTRMAGRPSYGCNRVALTARKAGAGRTTSGRWRMNGNRLCEPATPFAAPIHYCTSIPERFEGAWDARAPTGETHQRDVGSRSCVVGRKGQPWHR